MIFSWDDWNTHHVARHKVTPEEAEYVVGRARPPFPRQIGNDKFLVWGRTRGGRYLQVIFVYRTEQDTDYESIDPADLGDVSEGEGVVVIYVIHAMDLTPKMLKQYRRLRRRK